MTDFFPNETQDLLDQAARQPAAAIEETPGEAFGSSYDASKRYSNVLSWQNNMADAAQNTLDAFHDKTGETLPNPYRTPWNPLAWDVSKQMDQLATVRARTAAKAQELNDPTLVFPDEDTLYRAGIQKARASLGAQARLAEGQTTFGTSIASMAGGVGASFTDPMNLGLNAVAIGTLPEGGGIVRSLIGAGLNFGAQGAAEEASTYGYKRNVTPEYGPSQAFESVASSALGGVAFEAGGKARGALWRNARTRPDIAATLPMDVRDTAQSAERVADLDSNNPFRTGPTGDAAHSEAIVKIEGDLLNGREPQLPDAADTETGARLGDVHVPREPSPLELIDQQAQVGNPELFDRVGRFDDDITQARSALSDIIDRQPTEPPPLGAQTQSQLFALEQQLAAFTGKRRSSPRAQAIRDQISDLHNAAASVDIDASDRDAQTVQLLRQRLVDLTNERARLGVDVNAARRGAAARLGLPVDYAHAIDTAPSASGRAFNPVEPALAADGSPIAPDISASSVPTASRPTGLSARNQRRGRQLETSGVAGSPIEAAEAAHIERMPDHIAKAVDGGAAQKEIAAAAKASSKPAKAKKVAPPAPVTPEEAARAQTMAQVDQATGRAPTRAFFGTSSVRVRYGLAEAADLIASHDTNFNVNRAYPPELQPRDRNAAAAREQVMGMSNKIEPERLGPSVEANAGAPIVGPDNVVESGNGRTIALQRAYAANNEGSAAYRAYLERSGYDTTGYRQHVLVGRRITSLSDGERAAFAHAANGSASLRMSATEQALSDARHIDQATAALLQPGAIDATANRDFVRAFAAKLPQGERGSMMTQNGQLSAGGVNRVKAALVARAYGDADIVARAFDHPEPNIKTIASALVDASPDWIKMRDAVTRGEVKAGQDITDDMMQAVRSIMRARDERRPVGEVLAQSDMFASDTASLAARLFFKDGSLTRFLSKSDMAENLNTFARDTLAQRGLDENLFGEAPPTTKDVLAGAVRRSDTRQAAIADALKPSAIEKAFTDDKVQAAAEADLMRQIEQGKNRVPVEDAEGNVTLGFADKELQDIKNDIEAASEIRACSMPTSEAAE